VTATVTFLPSVGGDNSTVTDDSNGTTGLANGGHRLRFVPALAQTVAVASNVVSNAVAVAANTAAAAASAASAISAPGTQATSTTSLTPGTGSMSLTLAQTGKAFVVGQWVAISDSAAPATKWLVGAITAFNSGTGAMTVNVTIAAGSGAGTSWVVVPCPPIKASNSIAETVTLVTLTTQTAVAGNHYVLTNVAASTLTLPASPTAGDVVMVTIGNGLVTNVVARNAQSIMGLAEDVTINLITTTVAFKFVGGTLGWSIL